MTVLYVGRTINISSSNSRVALSEALDKVDAEITTIYNAKIPVEVTQERYDTITEHCRKDILVRDAVLRAIKETAPTPRE